MRIASKTLGTPLLSTIAISLVMYWGGTAVGEDKSAQVAPAEAAGDPAPEDRLLLAQYQRELDKLIHEVDVLDNAGQRARASLAACTNISINRDELARTLSAVQDCYAKVNPGTYAPKALSDVSSSLMENCITSSLWQLNAVWLRPLRRAPDYPSVKDDTDTVLIPAYSALPKTQTQGAYAPDVETTPTIFLSEDTLLRTDPRGLSYKKAIGDAKREVAALTVDAMLASFASRVLKNASRDRRA